MAWKPGRGTTSIKRGLTTTLHYMENSNIKDKTTFFTALISKFYKYYWWLLWYLLECFIVKFSTWVHLLVVQQYTHVTTYICDFSFQNLNVWHPIILWTLGDTVDTYCSKVRVCCYWLVIFSFSPQHCVNFFLISTHLYSSRWLLMYTKQAWSSSTFTVSVGSVRYIMMLHNSWHCNV